MAAPFSSYTEDYNGSVIVVSVERNTGSFESTGGPVDLHTIHGLIDSVEQTAEDAPLYAVDTRPGLQERIPQIITDLRNYIDGLDEFAQVLDGLGFVEGSEPIINYTVTPVSGGFIHNWDNDPDVDIESLWQYDDAAYTTGGSNIHNGALTPPLPPDTGYGSGVQKWFKMRAQRTGEDPGPWAYATAITL